MSAQAAKRRRMERRLERLNGGPLRLTEGERRQLDAITSGVRKSRSLAPSLSKAHDLALSEADVQQPKYGEMVQEGLADYVEPSWRERAGLVIEDVAAADWRP